MTTANKSLNKSALRVEDVIRFGLWLGVAATAEANREEYNMVTTWLPHLALNTMSLLLPDALRLLYPPDRPAPHMTDRDAQLHPIEAGAVALEDTLITLVRDNPQYVNYVAPLAIGYVLSHPRFNIYKGDWAKIRLAGLGLDALPHGATAFALTALADAGADILPEKLSRQHPLWPVARAIKENKAVFSLLVLASLSLFWETSEYMTHGYELGQKGGDESKINMQWSLIDTLHDLTANLIGWALATLLGGKRRT